MVATLNRHDDWVGELLLSGTGQQSLPGGGTTYSPAAAPVAVRQAQGAWPATKQYPEAALHQKLGLVRLTQADGQLSVGDTRDPFSESRMREMRLSGSMSGMWKRSHAKPD